MQAPVVLESSGVLRSLEDEVAQRTVRTGSLFGAAAALVFAALYGWNGPVEFLWPHLAASAVLAANAAIPSRAATLPLYGAITTALLLFGYQLVLLGGIENGIVIWFLVPFVATMMLGMRNLAIYSGVVTVVEVGGVFLGSRVGWIQGRVIVPDADLVMAMSVFSVMTLLGLFAAINLRARRLLMGEVAARNLALEAALEDARLSRNEAVAASEAKERFFANLTHEIRTPLTGIAGTAELLRQTALSADQRPLVAALGASTFNLVELVNAILDHAKMRAGHVGLDLVPLDPRALARDLRDLFGARAADKQLALEVSVAEDVPGWIETDGVKLRQILANLVANAVKFTVRGKVALRLRCAATLGGGETLRLVAEVTDTGVGIAPERLGSVFEPFVQGDASISRSHGGTGLGLAIARQLAELLGGVLHADSHPGMGSTFTLDIPVVAVQAPPDLPGAGDSAHGTPPASVSGLRALLVEDNPINQLVASSMLEALEVTVQTADNGVEAVALTAEDDYDVILMDLQMPLMDGITATREIRKREREAGGRQTPIIAMTGNSREDYGKDCTEAGMNGFVTKPIMLDELRGLLVELCPRRDQP